MPANKKHHYVPRFYLKFFSNFGEKTHIGLYLLNKKKFIESAAIDGQNYNDYFYGREIEVEHALGKLENKAKIIIENIINTQTLPERNSEEYLSLLEHIIYQLNRTEISAKKTEDLLEQVTKMFNDGKETDCQIEAKYDYPALASIENVDIYFNAILDLKIKLIINKSKDSFITSDNPVVKWNQFLKNKNYYSLRNGLSMRGLKLFFPISSKFMIIYYDTEIYDIGRMYENFVEVNSSEDIYILNLLQTIHCNEKVYFNENVSDSYVKRILNTKTNIFTKAHGETLNQNYSSFENLIFNSIKDISFINVKKKVDKMIFSNPNDYIRPSSCVDLLGNIIPYEKQNIK